MAKWREPPWYIPRLIPPDVVPNHVHIDAQHDDDSWHAVTGFDTIPAGMNPAAGIEISFSSGNPNVGGPWRRRFRVRWTLDGADVAPATEYTVLHIMRPMSRPRRACQRMLGGGWDCTEVLRAIGDALRRRQD